MNVDFFCPSDRDVLVGVKKDRRIPNNANGMYVGESKLEATVGIGNDTIEKGNFDDNSTHVWIKVEMTDEYRMDDIAIHGSLNQLESIATALLNQCRRMRTEHFNGSLTQPAESESEATETVKVALEEVAPF